MNGRSRGAFRTRDGHVNIAPMPAMWHQFCWVLGLDELSDDHDYASRQTRLRPDLRKRAQAIGREFFALSRDVPLLQLHHFRAAIEDEVTKIIVGDIVDDH